MHSISPKALSPNTFGWPLPLGCLGRCPTISMIPGLEKLLYRQAAAREPTYAEPDYALVHQELKKKGVTLTLLWEEYLQAVGGRGYQYTAFCTRYKDWAGQLKRSMRQIHRAGEKLFADYAGPTVPIIDSLTGEIRPASIFVAVLGASSYTFACATTGQTQNDWLTGIGRALTFIGGVPALIVPDNPRALVALADRYEPALNRASSEFADHFGTVILPARPRKPQDKAKVEVGVQVVERWILARLRHRRFFSVAELDAAVAELLPPLNNRPFKKLPGCRKDAFALLDAPYLRPLPDLFVRHRRLEEGPRQYRLPRRIRRQLLQRAACARPPGSGAADHDELHRSAGQEPARRQPWPQLPQGPLCDGRRAHARRPSRPRRLVARKALDLGGLGRTVDGRTHQATAHREGASRAGLSRLPGPDASDTQPRPIADGGGVRAGPGRRCAPLPFSRVNSREGARSPASRIPTSRTGFAGPRQSAWLGLLPLTLKGNPMLIQHTLQTLQALRLPGMATAFEEQQTNAAVASLSFDDRFSLLVDREQTWRENRRLTRASPRGKAQILASLRRGHPLWRWPETGQVADRSPRVLPVDSQSSEPGSDRRHRLRQNLAGMCLRQCRVSAGTVGSLCAYAAIVRGVAYRARRRQLQQTPLGTGQDRSPNSRRLGLGAAQSGRAQRSARGHR